MVMALIIGALAIGIVGWIWRINLAINHPEKEERLWKLGRRTWDVQAEVAKKLTAGARKGIAFGIKMRRRFK